METSDLSDPNSWRPVGMTTGNLDIGSDGTVGLNVPATGNVKILQGGSITEVKQQWFPCRKVCRPFFLRVRVK